MDKGKNEEPDIILSAPFHLGQERANAYLQRFGFRAEMDDMGRIRIYDADTGKLRYTMPKS